MKNKRILKTFKAKKLNILTTIMNHFLFNVQELKNFKYIVICLACTSLSSKQIKQINNI